VNLVKKHLFALEDAISAQVLEQASVHLVCMDLTSLRTDLKWDSDRCRR